MSERILKELSSEKNIVQTSETLRALQFKVTEESRKDFLKETIDCFETGANRATVVMVWILAIDHLFAHILKHKLAQFNASLAKDKSVKLNAITERDDFNELKEYKFIEICRAANIISNDVRKILDTTLGVRNSCAHPSGIKVPGAKVLVTVEDLVVNVLLKYEV